MNNQKESIKLARRLYKEGKYKSLMILLSQYGYELPYMQAGIHEVAELLHRIEQEYGILDEVLTESELDRNFRARCKSHEMRDSLSEPYNQELEEYLTAEDYGCVDLGDPQKIYRMVLGGLAVALTILAGGIIGFFLRLFV